MEARAPRPGGEAARRLVGRRLARRAQLAVAADDDEEELPWQVIAILDIDILEQLAGGYEYHKQRCAEAVAGRGVVAPPALTSLEGAFAAAGEGRWVYRVAAASGVAVYATPTAGAVPCGKRAEGEYVVGLETKGDGAWLRIEPGRRAYSDRYGASQNWVALRAGDGSDGAAPLTRVAAADGARVEVRALEGGAARRRRAMMGGGGAAEEAAPLTRGASMRRVPRPAVRASAGRRRAAARRPAARRPAARRRGGGGPGGDADADGDVFFDADGSADDEGDVFFEASEAAAPAAAPAAAGGGSGGGGGGGCGRGGGGGAERGGVGGERGGERAARRRRCRRRRPRGGGVGKV